MASIATQLEAVKDALSKLAAALGGAVEGAVAGASGDAAAEGGGAADAKAGSEMPSPKQHGGCDMFPGYQVPPMVAGDSGPGQKPEQKGDVAGENGGPEQKGGKDKGGEVAGESGGPEQKDKGKRDDEPGQVGGRRGRGRRLGHQIGRGHQHSHGLGHRNHDHGQVVQQVPTTTVDPKPATEVAGDNGAPTQAPDKKTDVAGDNGGPTQAPDKKTDVAGDNGGPTQTPEQKTDVAGDSGPAKDDKTDVGGDNGDGTVDQAPVTQVDDAKGDEAKDDSVSQSGGGVEQAPEKIVSGVTLEDFDVSNEFTIKSEDGATLHLQGTTAYYFAADGRQRQFQIPTSGVAAELSDGTRVSIGINETGDSWEKANTIRDFEVIGADGSFYAARTDDSIKSNDQVPLTKFHFMELISTLAAGEYQTFGSPVQQTSPTQN